MNPFTKPSRRRFLKVGAAAAAAVGFPTIIPARVLGQNAPSKRIHVGAIGVGARSQAVNVHGIGVLDDARIIACADPFQSRRDAFAATMDQKYGGKTCTPYRDFRELLARKDIDAVTICTGDQWHVPMAIAAFRAGKDVYVEKPLGTSMSWAWKLREEVHGKDVIFQYGTQQRSMRQFQQAVDLVRNGYIGKITRVDVWCSGMDGQMNARGLSKPLGSTEPTPVPEGLDYDLWLGPSPMAPHTADRTTNYVLWHNYDYALGFIAGWGAHPLDAAQWGLESDHTSPVRYEGKGEMAPAGGLYNTTRYWDVQCAYANGVQMHFMDEKTAMPVIAAYHCAKRDHGTVFHGEEGWVGVDRMAMYSHEANKLRKIEFKPEDKRVTPSTGQQRNFIDSVKSRQPAINPLESAIRSDTVSHLSDIAIRTGRAVEWDPQKEALINGSPEQQALLHRTPREEWNFFLIS